MTCIYFLSSFPHLPPTFFLPHILHFYPTFFSTFSFILVFSSDHRFFQLIHHFLNPYCRRYPNRHCRCRFPHCHYRCCFRHFRCCCLRQRTSTFDLTQPWQQEACQKPTANETAKSNQQTVSLLFCWMRFMMTLRFDSFSILFFKFRF